MTTSAKTLLLLVLLMLITGIALNVGKFSLTPQQLWDVVTAKITGNSGADDPVLSRDMTVFWQIRLPRIAAALIIGGAAYQGMFRNPLVSPDILGVSAGAGVGAILGIFAGQSMLTIQLFAFTGGLCVVALVYSVARLARQHDPVLSLVLVGIAVSALCGSAISLMKILADPYTQLPAMTFWLLGGLSAISPDDIKTTAPLIFAGMVPLLLLRWRMNLLSLSDEEARTLGLNVTVTRLIFIASATLITASAVSVAGIIGWLGLIVPHITRLLVGANFSHQLPVSLLIGAIMLLLTDTLARTIAPIELPLGILTSAVGAPFFIFLLLQTRRNG